MEVGYTMMHLRFSFPKTVLSLSGCVIKRRIRCPLPLKLPAPVICGEIAFVNVLASRPFFSGNS